MLIEGIILPSKTTYVPLEDPDRLVYQEFPVCQNVWTCLVERSDLFLDRVKPFNAVKFNYERVRIKHVCTQPMFIAKSGYSLFLFSDLSFNIYIHKTS